MRMMSVILTCLCVLSQAAPGADEVVVTSPDGGVLMTIGVNGQGQLNYSLTCQERLVVEPSALGITIDGVRLGRGVTLGREQTPRCSVSVSSCGACQRLMADRQSLCVQGCTHAGAGPAILQKIVVPVLREISSIESGPFLGNGTRVAPRRTRATCAADATKAGAA